LLNRFVFQFSKRNNNSKSFYKLHNVTAAFYCRSIDGLMLTTCLHGSFSDKACSHALQNLVSPQTHLF